MAHSSFAANAFIAGLGGVAVEGAGQQPAPGKRRVGLLMQKAPQDPCLKGLRELGNVEGNSPRSSTSPRSRAKQDPGALDFPATLL
jgi:hypothetical protein